MEISIQRVEKREAAAKGCVQVTSCVLRFRTCLFGSVYLRISNAMEETGQDETHAESTNSENGSEGEFVEVTREDAQLASQSWGDQPPSDQDVDLLGAADERDDGIGEEEEGEVLAADEGLDEEKVKRDATPSRDLRGPSRAPLVGVRYTNIVRVNALTSFVLNILRLGR